MIVQRRRRRVWVGSQGKLGLDRRVCGDGNCDCMRRSDRRRTHGTLMGACGRMGDGCRAASSSAFVMCVDRRQGWPRALRSLASLGVPAKGHDTSESVRNRV